ncbi:MAG: hypothetical protein EZS28_038954 [Streblomastix strix]|uniref:Uncharacterized protein n=1 Tax=Streblomastix strix TaxID=222440 RepID=A0A5J4U5P7_9EUKA|nr:MAG: hypothetical protein EZS28_038954 [Streblomastix strix]
MGDSNYNRLLRNQEKRKTSQILFNRKRLFSRELGRNGTMMGMRNTTITLSNLIDSSYYIQGRIGVGKRDNNSTDMERTGVVDSPNANYSTLEGAKRLLSVLKDGAWMKRNKQKLPPGKIWIFLVDGERRESNYSRSAYQILDQQDNQYKEQQIDGTEAGRDTHALQQYLRNIGLNNVEQFYNYQCWNSHILQQPITQHISNHQSHMHVQYKQGTLSQQYSNLWVNQ